MLSLSNENDSPRLSASFSEFLPVASKEFSVRVTAERLVNIESSLTVRYWGPLTTTGAVVDRKLQVPDTVLLEVLAPPQPPSDLPAQVVPHSL